MPERAAAQIQWSARSEWSSATEDLVGREYRIEWLAASGACASCQIGILVIRLSCHTALERLE